MGGDESIQYVKFIMKQYILTCFRAFQVQKVNQISGERGGGVFLPLSLGWAIPRGQKRHVCVSVPKECV